MRYVCVHGHFYQPPPETPSLEAIELQNSAHPCHDWNERVTTSHDAAGPSNEEWTRELVAVREKLCIQGPH